MAGGRPLPSRRPSLDWSSYSGWCWRPSTRGSASPFGPVATKRPGFTPRDANPACGPGLGDAAAREGLAVLAADPALVVAAVDAFHLGLWDSELSDPNPTSGDSVLMLALVAPRAVLTGAPDLMTVVLRAMDELVARRRLAPDLRGHPLDECTRILYILTLVDPPRWRRLRSAPGTLAAVASWVDAHPPAVALAEGSFPGAVRTGVLTLLHSHCVEPAGVLGCPAAVGVLVAAAVPRTTRLPPGAAAHGALIHLSVVLFLCIAALRREAGAGGGRAGLLPPAIPAARSSWVALATRRGNDPRLTVCAQALATLTGRPGRGGGAPPAGRHARLLAAPPWAPALFPPQGLR